MHSFRRCVRRYHGNCYVKSFTCLDQFLCLAVFPWAPFRKTKAAVKLHTLLDLQGSIPTFIHVSDGKLHDVNVLDLLVPELGAIYVMDRAYLDFQRLFALTMTAAFFVTRTKSNTRYNAFVLLVLGQAKADIVAVVRAAGPVAVGGTQVPRIVVPGSTPKHARVTATTCPGTAIFRGTLTIVLQTILYPLPHVAVHVMQPPGIGRETAYRRSGS